MGAECRSGPAQFCPEPAHLHGDNHPAVSIAIGTAPVVRSTDLSLGLHFCVVDTIPGFTYRVMVDHIRTGRVVQQREQVFTQQANASRYDAHLNLRDVPGDGQAGIQRLLIVVWDMCTEIKPSEALVGGRDLQFMPPPLPSYHQRLIDADFLSRSVLKDQPDIEGMGSGWSGRQCGRW